MIAAWADVELRSLEKLSHDELVTLLMVKRDQLELGFSQDWLEDQSTERLRIFLLAARLLCLIRQKEKQERNDQ